MSRVVAFLLAVMACALAVPSAADTLPTIELVPGEAAASVREGIRFREIGPDAAPSPEMIEGMVPVRHSSTQFGRVGETVVGALRFRNVGDRQGRWILSTGRGTVDHFSIYQVNPASGRAEALLTSTDIPAMGRSLGNYQSMAIEIDLAPGQQVTYLFKFRDLVSSWMPFSVKPYGSFFRERRGNIAMVAAVAGGSLMLILVGALAFASTGRREFLWLAAAEGAFAFNTLYAEGYATIFVLYRWPDIAAVFGEFTRSLFGLLMMQFGRAFLDTRNTLPRFDRFLRMMVWLGIAMIALTAINIPAGLLAESTLHQVGWLYLLAAAVTMPVLGVLALRRGSIYLPLFLAWSSMGAYIVYMTVAITGIFPSLPVSWHWIGPIGLFECLMATLTLALHLRTLYAARIDADRRAHSALLEKLALSEEAARLADDRARALSEVRNRDRLLQGSAHDTRHVLHALNSAVHFGRNSPATMAAASDLVSLLEASARHLEDIIASSVSIGNRDGRFLALGASDLAHVISSLTEIYTPIGLRAGIDLDVRCLQGEQALVDEALFARMVSNLLNNAVKFTCSGRVELSCENQGEHLQISVTDTGRGMPDGLASWLNDHAGDATSPPDDLGVGTGWRAIREIVELMHGSYTIDTDPRGTQVTVILPNPIACGLTPATLPELAARQPGLHIVGLEHAPAHRPAEGMATIVVADDAGAEKRVDAAARARALLVTPLCREMLDHPYVAGLVSKPAASALSTT
ncbi:hypothetical protein GRI40_07790 [Altererythrobacter aerius]|uniref:histidine kinase n=1 Tax=Tsuneonella aeria TaxID=1837929 RepID=A0A6I4TG59_9SPHN|nr:ATP-binding protein [Tsuneonella aeria]MXO75115.1 hypothetical protein [Tsuneonella aeria]